MGTAFGDIRTVPASDKAKKCMKQLSAKGIFKEQRDAWRLGAALGIATGETYDKGKRETFQNINSLDDEEYFAAVMTGLHPDLSPEDRLKKLVDYAERGIREIFRKHEIGTLELSKIGVL